MAAPNPERATAAPNHGRADPSEVPNPGPAQVPRWGREQIRLPAPGVRLAPVRDR